APCAGQKPLARLGETYRARGAVEKSHPEPRFELANRARNGGRRASEAAGGRGETPALGNLHKGCNAIDTVHTVAYNAIIYSNKGVLSFTTKGSIPFQRRTPFGSKSAPPRLCRARVLRIVP